ncbi:hypothetical protein PISL3812_05459 [Talaromyces islandicus]|uniref:Uncharacterized protein n=1 Tax=Talaromyces islandicus TaxID=28573 RepID=A0A0U1LYN5_TALIS|nr:hypothetical protein PISL3812_05459 [Talaromyces islandicus]
MTPQSSPKSLPKSPPNTEKKLSSRPTEVALVEPVKGTCSRDGKQVEAWCLPGPNQVMLKSWTPDSPLFLHSDIGDLKRSRLTCFNCDDFVVFVSSTKVMMGRLRMENIFNGDIEEAQQLGKIAEDSLDWTGPVDCILLTPELNEPSNAYDDFGSPDAATLAWIDAENHYLSSITRWGSRFRQRELEGFFWSKWKMAKHINFTVVPYQPFHDSRVPQSSFVTLLNEKAKEVLDMKRFVNLARGDPFVSRQHGDSDSPKLLTRVGGYGPWKQLSIRSVHQDVSVLTIGCSGTQHIEERDEEHTEQDKTYSRNFRIVYNA